MRDFLMILAAVLGPPAIIAAGLLFCIWIIRRKTK